MDDITKAKRPVIETKARVVNEPLKGQMWSSSLTDWGGFEVIRVVKASVDVTVLRRYVNKRTGEMEVEVIPRTVPRALWPAFSRAYDLAS